MRKKRYLEKLETFENELEFIKTHSMDSEATKRACLYSLQVCVDVALDVVAMAASDLGLVVEDDYTNVKKLEKEGALNEEDGDLVRRFNGLRNAIVHKYNGLDLEHVQEGLNEINKLYGILDKLVEVVESKEF